MRMDRKDTAVAHTLSRRLRIGILGIGLLVAAISGAASVGAAAPCYTNGYTYVAPYYVASYYTPTYYAPVRYTATNVFDRTGCEEGNFICLRSKGVGVGSYVPYTSYYGVRYFYP